MTSRSLTLAEIARKSRLTESTARRYTRLFAAFMPSEDRGRLRLFSPDCIPVLKRIKALYDAGHSTEQVHDVLNREYDRTVDIEAAHSGDGSPGDADDLAEQIASAMQRSYQAGQDIQKLKRAVRTMAGHLQQVRGEQKALPDPGSIDQILARLDRLEERVQALEGKERSWWRKFLPG